MYHVLAPCLYRVAAGYVEMSNDDEDEDEAVPQAPERTDITTSGFLRQKFTQGMCYCPVVLLILIKLLRARRFD